MSKLDRVLQVRKISKIKLEQQVYLLALKIKKEKEKLQLMDSYYQSLSQTIQPAKLAQVLRREKEFLDKMTAAYQAQKSHVSLLLAKQQEIALQCAILAQKCEKIEQKIQEQTQLKKNTQMQKMDMDITPKKKIM